MEALVQTIEILAYLACQASFHPYLIILHSHDKLATAGSIPVSGHLLTHLSLELGLGLELTQTIGRDG
mgnify:CR=1 FL=1